MAVDRSGVLPELRAMLEADERKSPASAEELTVAGRRAEADMRLPGLWGMPDAIAEVETLTIPGAVASFRARLYRPVGETGTVLFLHGGGWVVGSLDTHDSSTRALAAAVPANV